MESVKTRAEGLYVRLGVLHDSRMDLEGKLFNDTELVATRKSELETLKEGLIAPHLVEGQLPGKNHDIRVRKEKDILNESAVYGALESQISLIESNIKMNRHLLFKVEKEISLIRDRISLLNIIASSLEPVIEIGGRIDG